MKLKTFARRAAAAGAVLAALTLAALPALAAPKVQVSTTNAVADHADILSDETEQYVNDVSIKLSDACGAQIGVYTLDELLGSTTMEGFAYDVFNAWGLGSDDLDNGVLLLLAPNEADGGDYYIMRGDGLESQLSFSTLGSLLDEYMEPYWVNGDYDTGTQKTVQALANRLCSIYGVTLNSSYTDTSAPDKGGPNVMGFVLLVVAVLLVIWLITYLMRPRGPRPPRGGGGGSSKPTVDIPDDVPTGLNGDDHYAYIVGYPDSTVRPQNGITRAEVATIFFRLLTDETRTANATKTNNYADVSSDKWYNQAVSTLSAMGIVKGDSQGKFNPNAPITRAETVTILNRVLGRQADEFTINTSEGIRIMPDVPNTHWAYWDMLEATTDHKFDKSSGSEKWTSFDKEITDLTPGWHNIGGKLFHVNEDKQFDHDKFIGSLELDHNGYYITGSTELDALLASAVKSVVKDSMTQQQKLRAVYDYAKNTFG